MREDVPARATEGYYRSFLLRDVTELTRAAAGRRLQMPARLLYGTREPLGVDARAGIRALWRRRIAPAARGRGHWLGEERPDAVADLILAMAA